MLTKRIIPCLDIKERQVVKGQEFDNLCYAGDPITLAKFYEAEGADELVLLDITASIEGRAIFLDVVTQVAKQLSIPFTVGGGISSLADIRNLLNAGADKVSLNSAALERPQLIAEAAAQFGSQCITLALDVKDTEIGWEVFSHAGNFSTGKQALEWAIQGEQLGAGELLVTSINHDGKQQGYHLELIKTIASNAKIPIIASGGVGSWEHIRDVFLHGNADAALAASIFHFKQCSISELKELLFQEKIQVRR